MKRAALHNLGCKVNAYETEAMKEQLEKNGYEIVPFEEEADVYVVNTCTVTNIADRKSRQMLHRAKKKNPKAIVVAAGCYVQDREHAADSCVDIIIGNNKKNELVPILRQFEMEKKGLPAYDREDNAWQYEEMERSRTGGQTRAFVKIQDGCDQFCSYCIIPYMRGRARSREKENILEEIRRLAAGGYKEVVLTGIHLSSYGKDTKTGLLELMREIQDIDGIARIRLGSLEPGIVTEDFAAACAEITKVCPHFHLSLQSGCNSTLKRMNRHYSSGQFMKSCEYLRKNYSDPAITTDVIVGFPGETNSEFEESARFIESVNFYDMHVFKYSRRKGTKADRMNDQIVEEVKTERSRVLLAMAERKKRVFEEKLLGTTREVLVEEEITCEDGKYQVGYTREYVRIRLKSGRNLTNCLENVKICDVDQIIH